MITEQRIRDLATTYAESENSCYSNDYNGFYQGAKWMQQYFTNLLQSAEKESPLICRQPDPDDTALMLIGFNAALTYMSGVEELLQGTDGLKCCGRCDGVNDICIADMEPEERAKIASQYTISYEAQPFEGGMLVSKVELVPEQTKADNI